MVLVLDVPAGVTADRLVELLGPAATGLDLEITVRPITEGATAPIPSDRHVVSVYGGDHPGIVHAVTSLLAELDVNVTDLETRVIGSETEPVFTMLLEVALPAGLDADDLVDRLRSRGSEAGVEVSIHPSDADVL
jgi:glycine cleavage system transcriptional repressor